MYTFIIPSPFSNLPAISIDPLYAVSARAKKAGAGCFDASIGVILSEEGEPLMLPGVRKAFDGYAASFSPKDAAYPPLSGVAKFRTTVTELLFGKNPPSLGSIATTGGTGALFLNLRLLQLMMKDVTIILPAPAWVNHESMCRSLGMNLVTMPYLSAGVPSVDGIAEALKSMKGPAALLLQSGCHNPCGLEFSADQWKEIAALCAKYGASVLLDCAYQGLGGTPEEDALPVRVLTEARVPLLVAWSAAKNHTLYGMRPGLACAVAENEATAQRISDHYAVLTRSVHSAAAVTGQHIVTLVQEKQKKEWSEELSAVREILTKKRALLIDAFPAHAAALQGKGLFCLLPFSEEQLLALEQEHAVFLAPGGRLNLAGIPLRRFPQLIEKLAIFLR